MMSALLYFTIFTLIFCGELCQSISVAWHEMSWALKCVFVSRLREGWAEKARDLLCRQKLKNTLDRPRHSVPEAFKIGMYQFLAYVAYLWMYTVKYLGKRKKTHSVPRIFRPLLDFCPNTSQHTSFMALLSSFWCCLSSHKFQYRSNASSATTPTGLLSTPHCIHHVRSSIRPGRNQEVSDICT